MVGALLEVDEATGRVGERLARDTCRAFPLVKDKIVRWESKPHFTNRSTTILK